MAPLLSSPALESPSAPVGPQHAGWIWGAVKGQRRPSTAAPLALFPAQPHYRCHGDALTGQDDKGKEAAG